MINSDTRPDNFVEYAGGTVVNYGIEEVTKADTDGTSRVGYNYFSTNHPSKDTDVLASFLTKLEASNDKVTRDRLLGELVITANTVVYDANGKSIGNMAAVVSVANAKFNKLLAGGVEASEAYATVYKTTITWKGADNLPHSVQIESVVEAMELSMTAVAEAIGV